jgi:hypothetical protein
MRHRDRLVSRLERDLAQKKNNDPFGPQSPAMLGYAKHGLVALSQFHSRQTPADCAASRLAHWNGLLCFGFSATESDVHPMIEN